MFGLEFNVLCFRKLRLDLRIVISSAMFASSAGNYIENTT